MDFDPWKTSAQAYGGWWGASTEERKWTEARAAVGTRIVAPPLLPTVVAVAKEAGTTLDDTDGEISSGEGAAPREPARPVPTTQSPRRATNIIIQQQKGPPTDAPTPRCSLDRTHHHHKRETRLPPDLRTVPPRGATALKVGLFAAPHVRLGAPPVEAGLSLIKPEIIMCPKQSVNNQHLGTSAWLPFQRSPRPVLFSEAAAEGAFLDASSNEMMMMMMPKAADNGPSPVPGNNNKTAAAPEKEEVGRPIEKESAAAVRLVVVEGSSALATQTKAASPEHAAASSDESADQTTAAAALRPAMSVPSPDAAVPSTEAVDAFEEPSCIVGDEVNIPISRW